MGCGGYCTSVSRRILAVDQLQQFTAVELLSDPGHDPSPKPINNCMEVRLDYSMPDAKVGHNVLHARYPSTYPGTVTLANTLKTAFVSLFTSSALSSSLSTGLILTSVSLRDLGQLNQAYIVSSSAGSAVGTDATQPLPLEVAAVITERTNVSGPGGRGRIYMFGFTIGSLAAGNVITGSTFNQLQTFANGLQGVFSASQLTMCLALPSRIQYTGSTGRVHPARAAQTADVVGLVVRDNHWDSQRRRGLR